MRRLLDLIARRVLCWTEQHGGTSYYESHTYCGLCGKRIPRNVETGG